MVEHVMTVAESQAAPAHRTRRSLLDTLGGPVAVDLIVDRLIDELTSDPHLATRFAGVDTSHLRRAQRRFFIEAFGGAADGREPATPTLARVDGEGLVRIVIHLHDVLDSLGVPEPLIEQLLLAIAAKVLAGA